MEKTIKNYFNAMLLFFVLYFATRGIVKLFWNHSDLEVVKARTFILFILNLFASFAYIIITYHLVDGKTEMVHFCYKLLLIVAAIFIVVGLVYDIMHDYKSKLKNL